MSKDISERQQQLLNLVIQHYLYTAEPVGSKLLTEKEGLGVSGATVRNDMRALEDAGYLTHPHTSAGRIPTESGYKLYVQKLMQPEILEQSVIQDLHTVFKESEEKKSALKRAAKYIAEYAGNAVILGFGSEGIYYTGLSCLFANPEFKDHAVSVNISEMFDRCEQLIPEVLDRMQKTTEIFIGQENPLGSLCGTVASRLGSDTLFLSVGPMRMNYARNSALINQLETLFA